MKAWCPAGGGGQAADRARRRAGGHRPAHRGGPGARTIERLGLADIVHCHSGISDDELAVLYAEAQVAVVPSLYEGFSLPAIEAMACGVPLVATTGGALPEVVGTDGETGLLVPPDDPEALAGGSGGSWTTPPWPRSWGRGRARVLGRFTWEATARGQRSSTGWCSTGRRPRRRTAPGKAPDRRADRRLRPAGVSRARSYWTSAAASAGTPSRPSGWGPGGGL